MQRASQIIGSLAAAPGTNAPGKKKIKGDPLLEMEQIACAAWTRAVGKKIAKHSRAVKLVRGRLVVEVEDKMWQRNLYSLRGHICANVAREIGSGVVEELELRVMPRRREPQRAEAAANGAGSVAHEASIVDEADEIADPLMRRLYKASRQREIA